MNEEFLKKAKEIADEIKKRNQFLVTTNYDSVVGDEELLVDLGNGIERLTIEELYSICLEKFSLYTREDGKDVLIPEKIKCFTLNCISGKIELSPIKGIIKNKTTKKIVEVKTSVGSVKVTEDHSLITLKKNKLQEEKPTIANFVCSPNSYKFNGIIPPVISLKSKDLLTPHHIVQPDGTILLWNNNKKIISGEVELNVALMCFFGLWIGDGCYHNTKGGRGVHVSAYDDANCAKIIDLIFSRFGTKVSVTDEGVTAICNSTTLNKFMHHMGFEGDSYTKRVPKWVFGLNKSLIAGLLKGYFSADGTVSKGDVNATTYSKGLAKDIQTLLLILGIRSRIRKDDIGFKISINDSQEKRKFLSEISYLQEYKINKIKFGKRLKLFKLDRIPINTELIDSLRNNSNLKSLRDEFLRCKNKGKIPTRHILAKFLENTKNEKLKNEISKILENEIFYEKIKSAQIVSEGKETIVYDLETENGTFICNNLVLKNSDGISAGAIMCTALQRLGKSFEVKILKQLYSEEIDKIVGVAKNYIFIDFGSGQLTELKEKIKENFIVLDHHQPLPEEWHFHLNPLLFGVDGGTEISAAGVAYFVAKSIDENNTDLAALAIVGAVGDMQDFSGKLVGANQEILADGEKAGVLKKHTGLRLYGRISRPLIQFLQFSSNPIIPMLTANEPNCFKFLTDLGIELKKGEHWKSFEDLTKQEQEKLTSAIIVHMHKWGVPEWKIQSLIGEIYSLQKESKKSPLYDAKEFGTILNSTGRHKKSDIGLAVCMGDRGENYLVAMALLAEHRRQLREGIELLTREGVQEKNFFYFFDAGEKIKDSIIGIVAGMLYGNGQLAPTKPIIALVDNKDGTLKASGRATADLVRAGLNLGKIFKEMQTDLGEGTEGGGHCLHSESLVQGENGIIKEIKHVLPFDSILSKSGSSVEPDVCTQVFINEKNSLIIKTPVYEIECSGDHRLFKFENYKIVEIKADELKIGDFILAIRKIPFAGKKIVVENNPYCYLNKKGLEKLKLKRLEKKLQISEIINGSKNFSSTAQIYGKENFKSHRFKETQLNELLEKLEIDQFSFYKEHVIKQFKINTTYLDESLGWLIGYLQGDGFVGKKRIECKEPDEKIIENYVVTVKKKCSLETQIIDHTTYKELRTYSADFCRFLKNNFTELKLKSHELRVPERIMMAENEVVAAFLRGLFDADGGAFDRFVHLGSVTKIFLKTVQLLLLRFGIFSRVVKSSDFNKWSKRPLYILQITDFNSLKIYGTKIGFSKNSKKHLRLEDIINRMQNKKRNSNLYSPLTYGKMRRFIIDNKIPRDIFNYKVLYWRDPKKRITYISLKKYFILQLRKFFTFASDAQKEQIKNFLEIFDSQYFQFFCIKKIQKGEINSLMVDLSIPKTQNFMANGLIVHNSIAAGIKFPKEKKEQFLQVLDEKIKGQIHQD